MDEIITHGIAVAILIKAIRERDIDLLRHAASRVNWYRMQRDLDLIDSTTDPIFSQSDNNRVSVLREFRTLDAKPPTATHRAFVAQTLDIMIGAGFRALDDPFLPMMARTQAWMIAPLAEMSTKHNLTSIDGHTVPHAFVYSGMPSLSALLPALEAALCHGVDPNIRDNNGNTVFHALCAMSPQGEYEDEAAVMWETCMNTLLAHGYDPTIINGKGQTGTDCMEEAFALNIGFAYENTARIRATMYAAKAAVLSAKTASIADGHNPEHRRPRL